MINEILNELDLTPGEIAVFLNLIKTGSSTGGEIIKRTGLQSSTVYHCLGGLVKRGLVGYIIKGNKKYYETSDPGYFLELIKEKKKKILELEEKSKGLIKELSKIKNTERKKQEAIIYEENKGIKTAFHDILKTLKPRGEYYVIGARGDVPKWSRLFFQQFNRDRVKKKIKKKIIFNIDLKNTTGKDEEKLPYTTVRYTKSGIITPAAINIYANKVLIVIWTEEPMAFLLKSEEATKSFRQYFNLLWKSTTN